MSTPRVPRECASPCDIVAYLVERIVFEVIGEEGELAVASFVDGVATFARGSLVEHGIIRGEGDEAGGGE